MVVGWGDRGTANQWCPSNLRLKRQQQHGELKFGSNNSAAQSVAYLVSQQMRDFAVNYYHRVFWRPLSPDHH